MSEDLELTPQEGQTVLTVIAITSGFVALAMMYAVLGIFLTSPVYYGGAVIGTITGLGAMLWSFWKARQLSEFCEGESEL